MIIGFGHRARQGKNTAAQAVLDACPLDTQVSLYAFADALKMEVRLACIKWGGQYELIQAWKADGVMPDWVHYEDPKPRTLLQWWGSDYRRKQDPAYWVKRLQKKLANHKPELALITDVRFPNEADWVKAQGGLLVKCVRIGEPDYDVNEHWSEAALDGYTGWDHVIQAETAEECRQQARRIYEVHLS